MIPLHANLNVSRRYAGLSERDGPCFLRGTRVRIRALKYAESFTSRHHNCRAKVIQ
jgi:hypothetical protein